MRTEEEIRAEIIRCYKEYKRLFTPPISLNADGGKTHYNRGKVLLWVLGLKNYKDVLESEASNVWYIT